jgi:hypothetical protein
MLRGANNAINSVNKSQVSKTSDIKKSQLFNNLQHSQFQRLAVSSKILTLILRRDVDVRQGKMASLPYRQGSDTSHIYVALLNNYKNENFYKE